MTRLAEMEKELSEAKQAVILNAPRHQKLKEMSEGIVVDVSCGPGSGWSINGDGDHHAGAI